MGPCITVFVIYCSFAIVKSATCPEGCVCHNNECVNCSDTYYFNRSQCNKCNSRCLKCINFDTCTECEPFFGVQRGYCVPCEKGCATCKYSESPGCMDCIPNYTYRKSNRTCVPCPPHCISCSDYYNCLNSSCFICEICERMFFKNEYTSLCTPCPVNCLSCASSDSCTNCHFGHYGQVCQNNCPKGCLNNTCDKESGKCTCQEGLTGLNCSFRCPKTCRTCNFIANCSDCQGNVQELQCRMCVDGKFGKLCDEDCPTNCKVCSAKRNCSECYTGFYGSECLIPAGVEVHVLIIAVVFGSAAFLLITVIVTAVFIFKHKRKQRHSYMMRDASSNPAGSSQAEELSYRRLQVMAATSRQNDYSQIDLLDSENGEQMEQREKPYQYLEATPVREHAYSDLSDDDLPRVSRYYEQVD